MTKRMNASGGYDFSGTELKNIMPAQTGTSAAQWSQVQDLVTGQMSNLDYKGSVRVASTANVSVSTAPSTLDGVSLAAGNRMLLKNQTSASENGIYEFVSAGAALVRTADANASAEVTAGLWVTVEEGTVNADTAWLLTTNNPIVLDTTALTFTQYPPAALGNLTRYAVTGPGSSGTTWTITHNLGSEDVIVGVREVSTKEEVDVKITHTDTNTVTVTTGASMGANSLRAVVIG